MSGYLTNLIARTFEPSAAVRPRLAALFGTPPRDPDWQAASAQLDVHPSISEQSLHELPTISAAPPIEQEAKVWPAAPRLKEPRPSLGSEDSKVGERENLGIQASIIKPVQNEEYLDRPALPESLWPKAVDSRQPTIFEIHPQGNPLLLPTEREVSAPKSPRKDLTELAKIPGGPDRAVVVPPDVKPNTSKPTASPDQVSSRLSQDLRSDLQLYYSVDRPRSGGFPDPIVDAVPAKPVLVPENQQSHFAAGSETARFKSLSPPDSWHTVERKSPLTPEPTIHVSIGRIEVRAISQPPAKNSSRAPSAGIGLEEYLRRRSGRTRP
jgi:hypothetical protein